MIVGYARVSTRAQGESLATQREALTAAGATRVYEDTISGARSSRPGLDMALDHGLRDGDVLMVTRLDRLGRSTVDTLRTVQHLDAAGVALRALDLDLDTSSPSGRLVVSVLASLAQWERETMIERTREGLAHAQAQGRSGGRPPALTPKEIQAARAALHSGMTVTQVAALHGVSKRTISRVRAGTYPHLSSRPSAEG